MEGTINHDSSIEPFGFDDAGGEGEFFKDMFFRNYKRDIANNDLPVQAMRRC